MTKLLAMNEGITLNVILLDSGLPDHLGQVLIKDSDDVSMQLSAGWLTLGTLMNITIVDTIVGQDNLVVEE
jgi:hypothetical protein